MNLLEKVQCVEWFVETKSDTKTFQGNISQDAMIETSIRVWCVDNLGRTELRAVYPISRLQTAPRNVSPVATRLVSRTFTHIRTQCAGKQNY